MDLYGILVRLHPEPVDPRTAVEMPDLLAGTRRSPELLAGAEQVARALLARFRPREHVAVWAGNSLGRLRHGVVESAVDTQARPVRSSSLRPWALALRRRVWVPGTGAEGHAGPVPTPIDG